MHSIGPDGCPAGPGSTWLAITGPIQVRLGLVGVIPTVRGRRSTTGSTTCAPLPRWATLEGMPLRLVELPTQDGGLDLLIYNKAGYWSRSPKPRSTE